MAQAVKMDFDKGGSMAEEGTEEGGGGKKILIIIIIVVLLLAGGGAAAYFLLYKPSAGEMGEANGKPAQEEFAEVEEKSQASSAQEKAENPAYFSFSDPKKGIPEYITNLMDGRRFIVVKLAAEYEEDESEIKEFLDKRRPLLDDIVLSYLATLDTASAQHRSARDSMKKQIKRKVNALFNATPDFKENYQGRGNPIKQIVIRKFLLQ